jgi:hypothetical protein
LTETKEGSKKLIERNKEGERNTGTILEDAIIQLDSLDKLEPIGKAKPIWQHQQERLFNVALELYHLDKPYFVFEVVGSPTHHLSQRRQINFRFSILIKSRTMTT